MKTEVRRLFISDLPEGLGEEDLNSKFNYYGNVTSVEVKQRKDVSSKNATNRFAYINIEIDYSSLQQCLEEFTKKKWKGYYVNVQLAKESFLERLKREREEANQTKGSVDANHLAEQKVIDVKINGVTNKANIKKFDNVILESDGEEEENEPKVKKKQNVPINAVQEDSSEESEEEQVTNDVGNKIEEDFTGVYNDVVVKDNRDKKLTKKIESVGKEPIIRIEKKKPKSKDPSRTQADQKRLKSMVQMKRGYEIQKLAIKSALSKIDVQSKNKIIFDDSDNEISSGAKRKMVNGEAHGDENASKKNKKALFDDNESGEDDQDNINFEVKKQFEGKKGQKLMELQSKYKNDQRFQMDERFLEEDQDEGYNEENEEDANNENVDDKVTQEEKRKQLEILEQVLGKKITKTPASHGESNKVRKSMLRFDPDQPEHSKYEVRNEVISKSEKKKKKRKDAESAEAKEELPEVSKETFYEVKDAFKPAVQETQGGFSLLSMFGRKNDDEEWEEEVVEEKATDLPKKKKKFDSQNPFKYDSSDDERDDKPAKEIRETWIPEESTTQTVNLGATKLWTEPFFFTNDDYRFQEGLDFMKRIKGEQNPEFNKLRRDLKVLVRAKVKRNQRKNKPFQKKLGGAKPKKFKKFKNAKKR